MSTRISFRLNDDLYDDFKKMSGNLSDKCRTAIQNYVAGYAQNGYDFNYMVYLEHENERLWRLHENTMDRVLMLPPSPKEAPGIVLKAQDMPQVVRKVKPLKSPKKRFWHRLW